MTEITVSSQLKSANTTSDIENHSGKENRESFKHKNPDIDKTMTQHNIVINLHERDDLLLKHYSERIEKHNKNNNSAARHWDLEKFLKTFEGKTVKRKGKDTDNARWSTASQISYFGGKESLNPVLEELADAGASQEELREAYTLGYSEYVQVHNDSFPTLPIYRSDIHFDETTFHGHDAIVVMGHTEKGRASESINNALGEKYGYSKDFEGNKANMRKYRDENDQILFEAMSPKFESLGEKYGIDLEFIAIRTGQEGSESMEDYKKNKDYDAAGEKLAEREQELDFRSNAQKKTNMKQRERESVLDGREKELNNESALLEQQRRAQIAREKELKEQDEELKRKEKLIQEKSNSNSARERHLENIYPVVTASVLAIIKDDEKINNIYERMQKDGLAPYKPENIGAIIKQSIARFERDKERKPMGDKDYIREKTSQIKAPVASQQDELEL